MRYIKTYQIFEAKKVENTSGLWYHGDQAKQTDFANKRMDVEDFSDDRNAVGPGIYFTREKWQAEGYGKYVYTATLDIDPKRILLLGTKPNKNKIRKFINLAPDKEVRDSGLQNYAENIGIAVEKAIEMNTEFNNMHDACLSLYNDLYGRDSRAFGAAMVAIGYDAYLHHLPEIDHLIVWNYKLIKIEKEDIQ